MDKRQGNKIYDEAIELFYNISRKVMADNGK